MIRIDVAGFDRMLEAAPWGGPIRLAWRRLVPYSTPFGVPLAALGCLAREQSLRCGSGHALHFAAAGSLAPGAYEAHIARTGEVPTRVSGAGAIHDLLNALAWLAYPRIKAQLNAAQAGVIEREGIGARRGAVRDAATVFDENAAIFVTGDAGLARALRERSWHELFVDQRAAFGARISVRLFGHALVQKLLTPYKAICAHAWIVPLPADTATAAVDALLADQFARSAPTLADAHPLPVLGVPGWWPANADPGFYADAAVFRLARRRSSRAGAGSRPDACSVNGS